ncbi:5-formyltetrahydrofolate cyclo-ligase [Niveibacterium terrae]|uniref:5-formyltetrahydrofolate cyclo-ligase n=1 Tax=Niveibacterium terrae TaxID=3373598 RepID=UPI003A8E0A6B
MIHPSPASSSLSDKDFRDSLRRAALSCREALPPSEWHRLNALLVGHLRSLLERAAPRCLGFCWPYRNEPDLRSLVADWLAGDPSRRAALPVVVAKGEPLVFVRWSPERAMVADAYGIPVPESREPCTPDLVLIPLNAFDAAGFRLGYGGGYFDRTLAALDPAPQTVGVGFELGRVASIRPQEHDRPLGWIVTEAGAAEAVKP